MGARKAPPGIKENEGTNPRTGFKMILRLRERFLEVAWYLRTREGLRQRKEDKERRGTGVARAVRGRGLDSQKGASEASNGMSIIYPEDPSHKKAARLSGLGPSVDTQSLDHAKFVQGPFIVLDRYSSSQNLSPGSLSRIHLERSYRHLTGYLHLMAYNGDLDSRKQSLEIVILLMGDVQVGKRRLVRCYIKDEGHMDSIHSSTRASHYRLRLPLDSCPILPNGQPKPQQTKRMATNTTSRGQRKPTMVEMELFAMIASDQRLFTMPFT
ncbi:9641_t:CDS:2, partial [Acaulospora colombiana]